MKVVQTKAPNKTSDFDSLLNTGLNIYKAYSYGGPVAAIGLSAASAADYGANQYYGAERNYFSLSAFWGALTWKAVNSINGSSSLGQNIKIALSIGTLLSSGYMIYEGPDIFTSKLTIQNSIDSIKFTSHLFDNKGVIKQAEESFQNGYLNGAQHLIKNHAELLDNPFIKTILLKQSINLGSLFLQQQLFSSLPSASLIAFQAKESGNPMQYLLKIFGIEVTKVIVDHFTQKLKNEAEREVKTTLDKKVAELMLKEGNTQTILKLGYKANSFSQDVNNNYNNSETQVSNVLNILAMPLFSIQNSFISMEGQISTQKTLENYSHFVFCKIFLSLILSDENIKSSLKMAPNFLMPKAAIEQTEDQDETEIVKLGNMTVSKATNAMTYTSNNLQEIAKLGGNQFALEGLLKFIDIEAKKSDSTNAEYNNKASILIKTLVTNLLQTLMILSENITPIELGNIEQAISKFTGELGLNTNNPLRSSGIASVAPMERLKETFEALQNPKTYGAKRKENTTNILSVKNYKLGSTTDENFNKQHLKIDSLDFEAGKIYAITGQNGVGKTTFLNDISICSNPDLFNSTGEIFYPSHAGQKLQTMFRPTTPFGMPKTTLLERMTYQIPTVEREVNQESLLSRALDLFNKLKQTGLNQQILSDKKSDVNLGLSKGQEQISMLVGAIICKEHFKKPVLLILDESFGHIDSDTKTLLQQEIKKAFSDSIVISVDHHTSQTQGFYDSKIQLSKSDGSNEVHVNLEEGISLTGEDLGSIS